MRLTRNDRKAIIIIAGALLLLNVGLWIIRPSSPLPVEKESGPQDTAPTPRSEKEEAVGKSAELFTFDPNTADSATFVELGLSPRVARAIIHYRMAGGVFRTPQDFARIYTLSDKDFRRLLPYIYIKGQQTTKHLHPSPSPYGGRTLSEEGVRKGSPFPSKLHPGETVDINAADTTELKMIPGIGSYYSAKIVRYRERLGGFVNLDQLSEIEGLPEDIARWLTIGIPAIQRLPINSANFGQLLRHPYLNFEHVRAIMDYRKAYGAIRSFADLKTYPAFRDSDFTKLRPYLSFE